MGLEALPPTPSSGSASSGFCAQVLDVAGRALEQHAPTAPLSGPGWVGKAEQRLGDVFTRVSPKAFAGPPTNRVTRDPGVRGRRGEPSLGDLVRRESVRVA